MRLAMTLESRLRRPTADFPSLRSKGELVSERKLARIRQRAELLLRRAHYYDFGPDTPRLAAIGIESAELQNIYDFPQGSIRATWAGKRRVGALDRPADSIAGERSEGLTT
jgi:hypothetical protein